MTTPPARGVAPHDDLGNYRAAVDAALKSNVDVWGEQVLQAADGPSYEAVADYLTPVLFGDDKYLTDTGVHYLVFTEPLDADSFALHVADGSQILVEYTNRWGSPEWGVQAPPPARGAGAVLVYNLRLGPEGSELFGTHDPDLSAPSLAEGWLPILENAYRDSSGTTWRRESFATRDRVTGQLVSYLRVELATAPARPAHLLLTAELDGERIAEHAGELTVEGEAVHLRLANAVVDRPIRAASEHEYAEARARCVGYWRSVLDEGAKLTVPDIRVTDAWRNLVLQNSVLGERYSIGNPYETTFLMEAHGAVLSLLRWGFTRRSTRCLDRLADMTNGPGPEWYESWERGIKLSAAAEHARLTGELTLIEAHLDTYLSYLDDFTAQRRRDPHGLLAPERYAWDIPTVIYGWHSQATAWRGARDLLCVLAEHNHPAATPARQAEVEDFRRAIEKVMEASLTDVGDGSLFIPVALLAEETPHESLTGTRIANYWNLVAPYALATGIVERRSTLARGLLAYMATHGAWLLGLTRFNGLEDPPTPIGQWREDATGGYRTPGVDNAFGVQTLFFLADNDEADRLALAMYAKLAHGMTRGTFVDGEATTIGVYKNDFHRSTWYPPNGTSNSMFLEALRLMLVREARDRSGELVHIDLAWASPRWWLREGGTIALTEFPTPIGLLSFSVSSSIETGRVDIDLAVPPGAQVRLHVRLPTGWAIDADAAGAEWNATEELLDLGASGTHAAFSLRAIRKG